MRRSWWAIFVAVIAAGLLNPAAQANAAPVEQPVALPRQAWSPVGESAIADGSTPGSFRVSSFDLSWGGVRSDPAVGCDYTLSGSARVVVGDGYGFAVRADLSSGTPVAQSFQYDPGAGGYRDTQYPNSEGGLVTPVGTDTGWHRFSMAVLGSRYEARIDDVVVGSGPTALSCGGLYLRLWRGTAEFRDLTVTPTGPSEAPAPTPPATDDKGGLLSRLAKLCTESGESTARCVDLVVRAIKVARALQGLGHLPVPVLLPTLFIRCVSGVDIAACQELDELMGTGGGGGVA